MISMLVALTPAIAVQLWFAGAAAALTLALGCVLALLLEAAALALRGRRTGHHLLDGNALVMAALLWLLLPVSASWWLAASGVGIAIILGKHIFGGLGQNLFNPVMLAYLALTVLFADTMAGHNVSLMQDDATVHAYATSLALVAGGLYLLLRRLISWQIPVTMLVTTGLLHYVFEMALSSHITLLAAFFLATDPVTSPGTRLGKMVFGLLIVVISVILSGWLSHPAALAVAVLAMNAAVPTLDHMLKPGWKRTQARETAQ